MDETTIDREAMGQLAKCIDLHLRGRSSNDDRQSGAERDMSVACAMLSRGQTTKNDSLLRRAH